MKNIIHPVACLCLVVSSVFCSQADAQVKKQWIQDEGFGFKIQVPSNYQTSSRVEGTDKIHAFLSPDQNVAVRVRVIPFEGKQATPEQVEKIWCENVLLGAKREGSKKDQLNGVQGTTFGYRWTFNNIPCIVGAFVTVKRERAYVVWCLAPEPLFQKRLKEMSAITQTFQLLKANVKARPKVVKSPPKPPVVQPPVKPDLNPGLPATDPPPAAPTRNASKPWQTLVLDDCMIEFDYPARFTIQQKEIGQSQWWDTKDADAARVKMIIQSLDRQAGNTMQSVVKRFLDQVKSTDAATLIDSSAVAHPHLPVHQLSFKLDQGGGQATVFQYAVIDAPGPTVVAISYVTPQANAEKVVPMHERLLASLKPVKPEGKTPPKTGAGTTGGSGKATPPASQDKSTGAGESADDTTSKGAFLKMSQAAKDKDWKTLVTYLDGEAVQKVILDRMVNAGDVDLTGLPEDPLERLSALLQSNEKVKTRMESYAVDGEIFNIREENDEMHLIMLKLKPKGEAWYWMKKKNGRWVFSPN